MKTQKTWNPLLSETELLQPLSRKKETIYVLNDLFVAEIVFSQIDKVMAVIALCPQHTFQLATKDAKRIKEYFERANFTYQFAHISEYYERIHAIANNIYDILFVKKLVYQDEVFKFLYKDLQILSINNFEIHHHGWHLRRIIDRVVKGELELKEIGHHAYFKPFEGTKCIETLFPLPNLWLGVQIENQEQADSQIPLLLETPAVQRFVLCEPLLGKIDFTNTKELNDGDLDFRYHNYLNGFVQTTTNHIVTEFDTAYYLDAKISWVIVGGANGKNAQPMHPNWVRSIKNQCKAANVPFYFKGWGEWLPVEKINDTWYNNGGAPTFTLGYLADQYYLDDNNYAAKVGKEKSGCLLDGIEYKEYPK